MRLEWTYSLRKASRRMRWSMKIPYHQVDNTEAISTIWLRSGPWGTVTSCTNSNLSQHPHMLLQPMWRTIFLGMVGATTMRQRIQRQILMNDANPEHLILNLRLIFLLLIVADLY